MSDDRDHTASTVHTFITVVIWYLLMQLPQLSKVHYFSDGASAQYKNCKNFANLCHHQADFNVEAEWSFFATSHGKSPCDGIGGTVKRLVARASLQATDNKHILTPQDLYNWASLNIQGIAFFYVSDEEVQVHGNTIKERLGNAKTVPGTRSHHKFVPINTDEMKIFCVSFDDESRSTKVSITGITMLTTTVDINTVRPGVYVAAEYDDNWYIGCAIGKDEGDILINFMECNKVTLALKWPLKEDQCYVPIVHVLCIIPAPDLDGSSGRQYKLDAETVKIILDNFSNFKKSK